MRQPVAAGPRCANDAVQLPVASLEDRVGAPILQKAVAELRADGDAAS